MRLNKQTKPYTLYLTSKIQPDFEELLEKRKKLYELACKYDCCILEDNPYGDIRFDGEPIPQ